MTLALRSGKSQAESVRLGRMGYGSEDNRKWQSVTISILLFSSLLPLSLLSIPVQASNSATNLFTFLDDFDDQDLSDWESLTTPSHLSIVQQSGSDYCLKVGSLSQDIPPIVQIGKGIIKKDCLERNDYNITCGAMLDDTGSMYILFYWDETNSFGYAFKLYGTASGTGPDCGFYRNDGSGWNSIGTIINGLTLKTDIWSKIMVIVIGHTFYGYIDDKLAARATDTTYNRMYNSYDPSNYLRNPYGWNIHNDIGVQNIDVIGYIDDFRVFFLMYYDDCTDLNRWTVEFTSGDNPCIENGAIKSGGDVLTLDLGDAAFYDLCIDFDLKIPSANLNSAWFVAYFKYLGRDEQQELITYTFDIVSESMDTYQTRLGYGLGASMQQYESTYQKIPEDEWHHIRIVMSDMNFFGFIDGEMVSTATDDRISHGIVGFWSYGTSLVDNYCVKVLSYGDRFDSGTIDPIYWTKAGAPTIVNDPTYGYVSKLSYAESGGSYLGDRIDRISIDENIIGYCGYSIDVNIMGLATFTGNVYGYIRFGKMNYNDLDDLYVLCLDKGTSGIRFQYYSGTSYTNVGWYTNKALTENTMYHLTIEVNEERMIAYLNEYGSSDEPETVAMFEYGANNQMPFGAIGVNNHPKGKMYVDNFRLSLDTDYDDIVDSKELIGTFRFNDVVTSWGGIGPQLHTYNFVIRHTGTYYMVFQARSLFSTQFPLYAQGYLHGQSFDGYSAWAMYIWSENPLTINNLGTYAFSFMTDSNEDVEFDWIGLSNLDENLYSSNIEDADDASSWIGDGYSVNRIITHNALQWEFIDFDNDNSGDNIESRAYFRTSVENAFLTFNNYYLPNNWIWWKGKEFVKDNYGPSAWFLIAPGEAKSIVEIQDGSILYSWMPVLNGVPLEERLIIVSPTDNWVLFVAKDTKVNPTYYSPKNDDPSEEFSWFQEASGPFSTDETNTKYAVIVSGGGNRDINHPRFYNDVVYARDVLINEYGVIDIADPGYDAIMDQMAIVYADGNPPNAGNYVNFAPNLYLDLTNYVDFSATKVNIRAVFNTISLQADASDQLIVFVTDHGSGYLDPNPVTSDDNLIVYGRVEIDGGHGSSDESTSDPLNWNILDEGSEIRETFCRIDLSGPEIYGIIRQPGQTYSFDFDGDGIYTDIIDFCNPSMHYGVSRYTLWVDGDLNADGDRDPGEDWEGANNWQRVDGRDSDNNQRIDWNDQFDTPLHGVQNGIDFNGDGLTITEFGIDGGIQLWSTGWNIQHIWDDEFELYLSEINTEEKIFIFEQCFAGESIDDLSNNQAQPTGETAPAIWENRIIITACEENTFSYTGNYYFTQGIHFFDEFCQLFFNALERDIALATFPFRSYDKDRILLDTNSNDLISFVEAFNYASNIDNANEIPLLDDNYNKIGSESKTGTDLPNYSVNRSDGYLSSNTYL